MRKFLVAAALLAVAACGEKAKSGTDTTAAMAPTMAPTPMDSAKADSVRKDSLAKDSVRKADSAKAVKP